MKKHSFSLILLLSCILANSSLAADDPVTSFKRGVAKIEERKADIFGTGHTDIRFDVKKTDSLVTPILGIVIVESGLNPAMVANIHEFRLSYNNGKWTLDEYLWSLSTATSGDGQQHSMPLAGVVATKVQACFNAE